jgi:hypothetical protein
MRTRCGPVVASAAEQMARKASIQAGVPPGVPIFPALLVTILGPAGIQLLKALAANN